VDTPQALEQLRLLMAAANGYLAGVANGSRAPSRSLLQAVGGWLSRTWEVFGLALPPDETAGPEGQGAAVAGQLGGLCRLRDRLREESRAALRERRPLSVPALEAALAEAAASAPAPPASLGQEVARLAADFAAEAAAFVARVAAQPSPGDGAGLLALCDSVRDDAAPLVGVRVEDGAGPGLPQLGGVSSWKVDDRRSTRRDRHRRLEESAQAEEKKRQALQKQREAEEKKRAQAAIPPLSLFAGKFAVLDAAGIPTHEEEGKPLPKSRRKKLEKEMAQHLQLRKQFGYTD
jgi:hypothetical protein